MLAIASSMMMPLPWLPCRSSDSAATATVSVAPLSHIVLAPVCVRICESALALGLFICEKVCSQSWLTTTEAAAAVAAWLKDTLFPGSLFWSLKFRNSGMHFSYTAKNKCYKNIFEN